MNKIVLYININTPYKRQSIYYEDSILPVGTFKA